MKNQPLRQSSSMGGTSSAILAPTIAKNDSSWPIGSGMSDDRCVGNRGRNAARSATFRALPSDTSRAASSSVKVLWSWWWWGHV